MAVDSHAAVANGEITCPPYPVCVLPSSNNRVTINTKYGKLIPLHNMPFNAFYVNANGSIYFNTTGLEPRVLDILRFNVQSYGNGSFDLRFMGPPALAANCQCPMDPHLTTQLPQGPGTELFFLANMASSSGLTVQWTPIGGGCVPFCFNGSSILPALFFWTAALMLGIALMIGIYRRRKRGEKPVYELTVGQ